MELKIMYQQQLLEDVILVVVVEAVVEQPQELVAEQAVQA